LRQSTNCENAMSTHPQSALTNALLHETSPYLQQHAQQPVQWYPWGESALNLARQQDKPILLSIGYSACHWCHVMAHESFEDIATANIMNEWFINIKVDREERPDIDKIYQMSLHLLLQRPGGWPLTMFLTPDQRPFFGGTYFPPIARHGLPAFSDLLKKVAAYYREHREEIETQGQLLVTALQHYTAPATQETVTINPDPLNLARQQIAKNYDEVYGGFSSAPKFPHIPTIERLFHHYLLTAQQESADDNAIQMALLTLKNMALGGIYDQLGGGFYRYSTDERWLIPHFEKMLYDNGLFLSIYSDAWQISRDPLFKKRVTETADWVIREMRSPQGAFYSSLDADSEGKEGLFYLWTPDQVKSLLDTQSYTFCEYQWGLDQKANFEQKWHLSICQDDEATAEKFSVPLETVTMGLTQARQQLLTIREQRIHPGRDDKILTAWNALMIKGLAKAGRILERSDYLDIAEQALDFIKETLWVNGHLLATCKERDAHLNAYLDDYAFLLDAILTLLQARWRDVDLYFAIDLAEVLLNEFEDVEQGGFFFTSHHHETLISRPKPFADEAIPSGNGVAAHALGRLGYLLSEPRYLTAAERTLRTAWIEMMRVPDAHNHLLLALEDFLFPPQTIILRGEGEELQRWQAECQKYYMPRRVCLAIPHYATHLPTALADKKPQGSVIAYFCRGYECQEPITTWDELQKML